MQNKIRYPGDNATQDYLCRVMSDGRWRNSNDLVARAKRDGIHLAPQAIGHFMGHLAKEGRMISDQPKGEFMWKARTVREAAE